MKTNKSDCWIHIPDLNIEDLPVTVDWYWENNGIGAYEYWGAKCFDAGENYIEINEISPVFGMETPPLREKILKYIDDNFEKLSEGLAENIGENQ